MYTSFATIVSWTVPAVGQFGPIMPEWLNTTTQWCSQGIMPDGFWTTTGFLPPQGD
jgi:hypothetical protein